MGFSSLTTPIALGLVVGATLTAATVDPFLLKSAPTALERLKLLADSDLMFDFNNPPSRNIGQDGSTVAAHAETFPGLIGEGIAMVIGSLGPCGYNTPHVHPRATELFYNLNSTSFVTGNVRENGARLITQNLKIGQATVFPAGSIHYEVNLDCTPATFISALGHEDFGVLQIAQGFLSEIPQDALSAAIGEGVGYEYLPDIISQVPTNVAFGTEECLKRCGITRPKTSVEVKSPKDGSIPTNFTPDRSAQRENVAAERPKAIAVSNDLKAAAASLDDNEIGSSSGDRRDSSALLPLTIASVVINGLLAAALVALAAMTFFRRRATRKFAPVHDSDYVFSHAIPEAKDPYDSSPKSSPKH